MEKLFTTPEEALDSHLANENVHFFSLMDRLRDHSHWKYPERPWSLHTYYNISVEWADKIPQLEQRVEEQRVAMQEANQ